MSWPTKKIVEISICIILLIFASLFFWVQQYWISFFTLVTILVVLRINDLQKLSVTKEGLVVSFNEISKEVSKIVRSDKPIQEKVNATQKLIDEIFRLGYISGGGKPFNMLNNVQIIRDKKGNITGVQYDEN